MKYTITFFFFLFNLTLISQKIVKGIVIDDTQKEPLIGATIFISKTSLGFITDIDGSFSIDLPEGKKLLEVSFIGYQTEFIQVPDSLEQSDTLIITMKMAEIIDCYDINYNYYDLSIFPDIINAPIGGLFEKPYLNLFGKSIDTKIGYQTNLKGNSQTKASFKIGIHSEPYFFVGVKSMFHAVRQKDIIIRNYQLTSTIDTDKLGTWLSLQLGGIRTQISKLESSSIHHGISFGIGKSMLKSKLYAMARTNYLGSFWMHNAELRSNLRRYRFSIMYTKMNNYQELSLSIGYRFYR